MRNRCLLGCQISLKNTAFQPIEQIALLDLGALDKTAFLQSGGDARHQINLVGRLDAANIGVAFHHRLFGNNGHPNVRRSAGAKLGMGGGREQNGEGCKSKTTHR